MPRLSAGTQLISGVFNLFSPTEQPNTKVMVYELGYTLGGADRYLAGDKAVCRDTTTLSTQLQDGTDKGSAVLGAGILTLGVTDLVALVSTLRVTGTLSAVENA